MIYAILLGSLILAAFFRNKKREWKEINEKAVRYFLYDKFYDFFVCLSAVSLFFSVLQLFVEGTSDRATLGWLERLEEFLQSIEDFAKYFKLTPVYAAAAIFVLLAFDFAASFLWKPTAAASSHFKTYNKFSKRAYTFAVVLCSFTFFGNEAGEEVAHLQMRAGRIKAGYAKAHKNAEELLSAAVQQKLYEKIVASPRIKDFRSYPKDIGDSVVELAGRYEKLKQYGVRDAETEAILRRYKGYRASPPPGAGDTVIKFDDPKPDPGGGGGAIVDTDVMPKKPPGGLTAESVESGLSKIEARTTSRSRFVALLKLDGSREILCQFPKFLTSAIKEKAFSTAAVQSVVESYPVLAPVFEVFTATLDKSVEEKVKRSVDRMVDSVLTNPDRMDEIVSSEAGEIVDTVELKSSPTLLQKIQSLTADIENQLAQIRSSGGRLLSRLRVEEAKAAERKERADVAQRKEVERLKKLHDEEIVDCYCGETFIGTMKRAQCPTGARCS